MFGPPLQLSMGSCLHCRHCRFRSGLKVSNLGQQKIIHSPLPDAFLASKQKIHKNLEGLKQVLREADFDESRKKESTTALHGCFKDLW